MGKLEVIVDDIQNNPCCRHGPTVLFRKTNENNVIVEEYYACTASRDGKCPFKLKATEIINFQTRHQQKEIEKDNSTEQYDKVRDESVSQKAYCIQCQQLLLKSDLKGHENHKLFSKLSDDILREPTRFLAPLSKDGNEAQYFFSDTTLTCMESIFKHLKITRVICMGAPRLHEHLLSKTNIRSLLLDIDARFHWFYDESSFLYYNMFNHFFFNRKKAEGIFNNYLISNGSTDQICIVTDPPFGCRTELLANTIRRINQLYNEVNQFTQAILPTFWIFPYFMEVYIQNELTSMEMSDYQVNYTNHRTYHNGEKSLKHGSPVRIFTNVPLDTFQLPHKEGYKWCPECQKSVHKTNRHCFICGKCTSKNGAPYRHCTKCNWCVKPNYKHCDACGRCTQVQGHSCASYSKQVTCRICSEKGHAEKSCSFWRSFKLNKVSKKGCIICGSKKHTFNGCEKRKRLLDEQYFLGRYYNRINCAI